MSEVRTAPLLRLLRHASAHRARIVYASACSILGKIFDLAPPMLIGAAINVVVERENSLFAQLGVVDVSAQLYLLAALTVLIWMLESLFEYLEQTAWRNLAQQIQHELRIDAYRHLQRLELAYFEDARTGNLLAILSEDVNQLERFLDGGANDLLQVGTTVIVVSVAFAMASPYVAALAMLPIPVIVWGSLAYQRAIGPRYAGVRAQAGELTGLLEGNLQGIATIKACVAEDREVARVEASSLAYREANRRAIQLSAAFSPLIRMVIVCGFVATLVIGGQQVIAGNLDASVYAVMVFLTQRLLWPLTRLGVTVDLYQRAMASVDRILDLLAVAPQPRGEGKPVVRSEVIGELAFEGVHFNYGDGRQVFRGLDLVIPAGQTTAIVGSTGSGKSTLVKLLLRFYDPSQGRVTLDGHDLRELELSELRHAFGYVPQEPFLFDGSVRDNVVYAAGEIDDAAIERACDSAEADAFVRALPEGYATVVGERGQKLSGGQRQRLSIARAIAGDPPILVLDEATSAVDNETEAAIQRSLELLARERTAVVIAHRLSTIRNADQIVVLDQGAIAEVGTHDALLARDGIYAHLWRVQTGERSPRPASSA